MTEKNKDSAAEVSKAVLMKPNPGETKEEFTARLKAALKG